MHRYEPRSFQDYGSELSPEMADGSDEYPLSPPPLLSMSPRHNRHTSHRVPPFYGPTSRRASAAIGPPGAATAAAAAAIAGREVRGRGREGFPLLQLTQSQTAQLRAIEQRLLEQYLERYEDFVGLNQRVVDSSLWKLTRQANGVKAYKRRSPAARSGGRRGTTITTAEPSEPMLLVVGSIDGSLEDVLYGAVWNSRDERSTRSHFTKDGIVDASVLASLEKASPMDPFRSLAVKWSLKRSMKSAAMIKDRDFVFLGATGTLRSKTDERIGFELRHSLKIPSFPPIAGGAIVRAEIMSCSFFRQMRGGRVEVFHQASFDAGGGLLSMLAWNHAIDTYVGFASIVECSNTKKLVRAVQWSSENPPPKAGIDDAAHAHKPWDPDDKRCGMCGQPGHSLQRKCALCYNWVCSNCSIRKEVFTPLPGRPPVARCFCKTCLNQVVRDDPTQYVLRELEQFEQRSATEFARSPEIAVLGDHLTHAPPPPPPPPPPSTAHAEASDSVFFALDSSPPLPSTTRKRHGSVPMPVAPPAPMQVPASRRMSVPSNVRRGDPSQLEPYNNENYPPNTRVPHNRYADQGRTVEPSAVAAVVRSRRHSTAISTRSHASKNHEGEILLKSDAQKKKWQHREQEQAMNVPRSRPENSAPNAAARRRMTVLGSEGMPPPPRPSAERLSNMRRVSIAESDQRRRSSALGLDNDAGRASEIPPPSSRRSYVTQQQIPSGIPRPSGSGRAPVQTRMPNDYANGNGARHAPPSSGIQPRQQPSQVQFRGLPAHSGTVLGEEPFHERRHHSLLPHPQPQALTSRREMQRGHHQEPVRRSSRLPPPPQPQEPTLFSQYEELRHFYQQEYEQKEDDYSSDDHTDDELPRHLQQQYQQQQPQPQPQQQQHQEHHQQEHQREDVAVDSMLAQLCEIARMTGDLTSSNHTSMHATDASSAASDARQNLAAS